MSIYVNLRQSTSIYVNLRQATPIWVSFNLSTSIYVAVDVAVDVAVAVAVAVVSRRVVSRRVAVVAFPKIKIRARGANFNFAARPARPSFSQN